MKSLRLRSAITASIASMLICTMLLGSVLISNVYAKGSGSEKSQYNLDENCKDDHKGKQITITGTRSVEKEETTSDIDGEIDEDALPGSAVIPIFAPNGTVIGAQSSFKFFIAKITLKLHLCQIDQS